VAERGAIRAIIEAVDRVTAPVRRMGAGVTSIVRSLNLEQARAQIARVATGLLDVAKAAVQMAARTAVSATAAATALALITRSVAETTQAAVIAARSVNVTLQGWQAFGHAASLVGSSSDQMGAALGSLRDKALEAARGNWELRVAFRRMGVQLLDSRGQLRPTEQLLADVADAFARVPDSARRTAAAVALFGEAGVGLIPMLAQGSLGLRVAAADARNLGLVLTNAEAGGLTSFNTSLRRLTSSITGVWNAIAVRLAPILTPLVNDLTNWIAANRQLIATRIEEYVRAIPGVVQSLREQVEQLWGVLRPFVTTLGEWAESFGAVNTAALVLGVWLGGGLLANIIKLAAAIVGPGISALIALFQAIRVGTGVMAAFNLVLLANPIGLVVAAVALLGGAAYLIYKNWSGIVSFFQGVWDGIKGALNAARLPEFAGRLWDDFKTPFVAFGGWVVGWASGPVTQAVEAFKAVWAALPAFFQGLWDQIKASFDVVWSWVRPIIERIERFIPSLPSATPGLTPREQPTGRRPGTVNGARRIDGYDDVAPPVRPITPGAGSRLDAGGRLDIRVTDDRVSVTRAEPNDRRIQFNTSTDTGEYMAMP
jgi:hypothetical protein